MDQKIFSQAKRVGREKSGLAGSIPFPMEKTGVDPRFAARF